MWYVCACVCVCVCVYLSLILVNGAHIWCHLLHPLFKHGDLILGGIGGGGA